MLVEIGYALAKGKPFALALRSGVDTTSISQMAEPLIMFESLDELLGKLKEAF
jgi:nucleoside 2-deoxyribosyltransferase